MGVVRAGVRVRRPSVGYVYGTRCSERARGWGYIWLSGTGLQGVCWSVNSRR